MPTLHQWVWDMLFTCQIKCTAYMATFMRANICILHILEYWSITGRNSY